LSDVPLSATDAILYSTDAITKVSPGLTDVFKFVPVTVVEFQVRPTVPDTALLSSFPHNGIKLSP
jgi:hypothetical protein